jgi:hypothetical protein
MAKREIVSRGQDHTDEMRDRLAEREDVEAKIKVEQANEAEMLRSECQRPALQAPGYQAITLVPPSQTSRTHTHTPQPSTKKDNASPN